MHVRKGPFTEDYANGFAAGIELVNDSAITDVGVGTTRAGFWVEYNDEDAGGDEIEIENALENERILAGMDAAR